MTSPVLDCLKQAHLLEILPTCVKLPMILERRRVAFRLELREESPNTIGRGAT